MRDPPRSSARHIVVGVGYSQERLANAALWHRPKYADSMIPRLPGGPHLRHDARAGTWLLRLDRWIRTDKRPSIPRKASRPAAVQAAGMAKNKRKRNPKTVLKLADLEQSKSAVLNSLTSQSSQRSYDYAIREFDWYCSEPRLAFNKTVVTRYRISFEQAHYASSTINLRLTVVRRPAYEASDCGLRSPDLAAGPAG